MIKVVITFIVSLRMFTAFGLILKEETTDGIQYLYQ